MKNLGTAGQEYVLPPQLAKLSYMSEGFYELYFILKNKETFDFFKLLNRELKNNF